MAGKFLWRKNQGQKRFLGDGEEMEWGRKQPWAGIPDPGNSREYRPPIPVPKVGNGIFHSQSRSRKWEWNFSLSFPFPKMGMEFYGIFIPVPVTGNGTSKSGKVPFLGTSCISGKVKANWIGWMDLLVVLKYTSPYCATNTPKTDVTPWGLGWIRIIIACISTFQCNIWQCQYFGTISDIHPSLSSV